MKNLAHWQYLEKYFNIDLVNHSWSHLRLDSDIGDEQLKHQIIGSMLFFQKYFKSPSFSFIPAENQMTGASYKKLSEGHFLAARGWHRKLNSIAPEKGNNPGDWYNLNCRGIGDAGLDVEKDLAEMAIRPAWLIEMWHNVTSQPCTSNGYQSITQDVAKYHIKALKDAPHVWFASFNEAISYIYQRENIILRSFKHGDILHLKLDPNNPHLPWHLFNVLLTIRIEGFEFNNYELLEENIENISINEDGDILINILPSVYTKIRFF